MRKRESGKYFIKKQLCLLLLLCLSAGLFAGCGKDADSAESGENTEAVKESGDGEVTKDETPDAGATDPSGQTADDRELPGMAILHPTIAAKEIYTAKPNDSSPFIRVNWNTVTLSGEDAETYPRLAKALAAYAKEQDDLAENFNLESRSEIYDYLASLEAELTAGGQAAEDWYLEQEEWPYFLNFRHEKYLNIVRCDEVAFTVQEDFSNYTGGAHGYYAYYGKNFDTRTGHLLMVEDVVKDLGQLNQILHDRLMEEYADLMLDDAHVWEDLNGRASGEYNYAWLLGQDKVTFYFNPYDLTAYAGGMQVIDIPFSEYPDLFEEHYTKAPEEYVVRLGKSGEAALDVDGDGAVERLSAYVVEQNTDYPEDTESYRSTVSVTIGEETENFSVLNGYDGELYLIHTGGGTYLYFNAKIYDYSSLMCIDLSDGTAKRVHRECKFEPYLEDEKYDGADLQYGMNEGRVELYREAFTDPHHLTMSLGAERTSYHVGEDGMLTKEGAEEEPSSGRTKEVVPDSDIRYAGTYWSVAYIESFSDFLTPEERFVAYEVGRDLDLFVYEDGTALFRSILNSRYEPYACRGSWVSDGRGGIRLADCTDPDGDERSYYDSFLVPHLTPASVAIDGEDGLLAMEFYDKCVYFRQEEMPDAAHDVYAGIDLSAAKKVKSVVLRDGLSGEWILNSVWTEDGWTDANLLGEFSTVSLWNEYADFYDYSEKEGRSEQYYGMMLTYEDESFWAEDTEGYTLYAYPDERFFEGMDYVLFFRIAPYEDFLMVQKLCENWEGEVSVDGFYYFSRAE